MNLHEIREEIHKNIKLYFDIKNENNIFIPQENKVQYSGPVYDDEEIIAITDSILDGWFGIGKIARKFEEEFSEYMGVYDSIVTNSGSSANLITLSALMSHQFKNRLVKDDEVITPALTFPTTFNPIIQNGLKPVLIDVDLGTYNMNIEQLENAITEKTRAIILLHQLGNPNPMDKIMDIAKRNNLFVIEDTCDALGAKWKGKLVGTFGDLATFSFYVAHHITMGEGGAIITNNHKLSFISRSIRDWGRACACKICEVVQNPNKPCRFKTKGGVLPDGYDIRYVYSNIGYNLKPMEFQTAMGRIQLKKLENFIKIRNDNFKRLFGIFSKYEEFFILPKALPEAEPAWFAFPLTIKDDAPFKRNEIIKYFESCNVETRLFFSGNIIRHPAYLGLNYRVESDLENADKVLRDSFFMGIYPGIDEQKMDYVIECVEKYLSSF